ncbi:MAG: ion channel [Candidatus Pacearchaeota archaeon]|jgi:hypothetical protein
MKKRESSFDKIVKNISFTRLTIIFIISVLIMVLVDHYITNNIVNSIISIFVILVMVYFIAGTLFLINSKLISGKFGQSILAYMFLLIGITFLISILFSIIQINGWGHLTTNCSSDNLQNYNNLNEEYFYFTSTTLLTVGYGDICPVGFSRIIASLTGFIGMFISVVFFILLINSVIKTKK